MTNNKDIERIIGEAVRLRVDVNSKNGLVVTKKWLRTTLTKALQQEGERVREDERAKNTYIIRKTKPKKGLPNGAYVAFSPNGGKQIFGETPVEALTNLTRNNLKQ